MSTHAITQPGLFDRPATAQERFEEFHRLHPLVYLLLCRHARDLKDRGFTRYSIKTIWAVLRWHADTGTSHEPFKLDDRYYSRYARVIMESEQDLAGFFNTRGLRTK